ncbi:hypothetical protein [Paenibacillus physcomitrellae]|nr:hypothetical protein [Paenibacillus physcomitrellae]
MEVRTEISPFTIASGFVASPYENELEKLKRTDSKLSSQIEGRNDGPIG